VLFANRSFDYWPVEYFMRLAPIGISYYEMAKEALAYVRQLLDYGGANKTNT
jgi:hypothetical protein